MRSLLPGLALLFALACAFPAPARAGVSVSLQEDGFPFLKKDPALLDFVQKCFEIENVGWAPNNGQSFTNSTGGPRILPYGFRAKPKGQDGPYTVLVLIEQNAVGDGGHLTRTPLNKVDPSLSPGLNTSTGN